MTKQHRDQFSEPLSTSLQPPLMTKSEANNRLGTLWATEHSGGLINFDPALAALLIQLAEMLIGRLVENCNETPESLHDKAVRGPTNRHKKVLGRWMRRKMGWWQYRSNGGTDLVDSAISTMSDPKAVGCCRVLMER